MDKLIWLVTQIWDWIAWANREFGRWLVATIQTGWGRFLVMVGWIWTLIQVGRYILNKIINTFSSDFAATFNTEIPGDIIAIFSVINYCTPLVELITYMIAYGGVLALMAWYRHLKSLVPGPVSGGT